MGTISLRLAKETDVLAGRSCPRGIVDTPKNQRFMCSSGASIEGTNIDSFERKRLFKDEAAPICRYRIPLRAQQVSSYPPSPSPSSPERSDSSSFPNFLEVFEGPAYFTCLISCSFTPDFSDLKEHCLIREIRIFNRT